MSQKGLGCPETVSESALTQGEFFRLVEARMPYAAKMHRPRFENFDIALVQLADKANGAFAQDPRLVTETFESYVALSKCPSSLLVFATFFLPTARDMFLAWAMFLYAQYEDSKRHDQEAVAYLSQPFDLDADLGIDTDNGAMSFFGLIPKELLCQYAEFMADVDVRVLHLVFAVADLVKVQFKENPVYIGVIQLIANEEPGAVDKDLLMQLWPQIKELATIEFDLMSPEYWRVEKRSASDDGLPTAKKLRATE